MLARLLTWLLNWILEHGSITIVTSAQPFGRRIGGADIPGVKDKYLVIQVSKDTLIIWAGYWQLS